MKRTFLLFAALSLILLAGCDIRKDICENHNVYGEVNESYIAQEPYFVEIEYEDCLGRPARYNIETQKLSEWSDVTRKCQFSLTLTNPEDNPATYEVFALVRVADETVGLSDKTTISGHDRALIRFDIVCNESDEVSLETLDIDPSTINDCRKKEIKVRNETRYNNITLYRKVNTTSTQKECRKQSWKEAFFGND